MTPAHIEFARAKAAPICRTLKGVPTLVQPVYGMRPDGSPRIPPKVVGAKVVCRGFDKPLVAVVLIALPEGKLGAGSH